MSELILHPKTVELRRRATLLRQKLADLLAERIRIIYTDLPDLRYRYHQLFGPLEREVQEKTLEMSERRRMVELFALKLDRGQTLDEKTITLTMKVVYNEFRNIRQQVERISRREQGSRSGEGFQFAGSRNGNGDTDRTGDSIRTETYDRERKEEGCREEVRKLYRLLAKQLHPDRAAEDDPTREVYWTMTTEAYRRFDLDMLRALHNTIRSNPEVLNEGRLETPAEEIVRYIGLIEAEEKRIAELKLTEPYSVRLKLEDDRWVTEQQERLQKTIRELELEIERHNQFLAPILSRTGSRVMPENVQDVWNGFVEDVYLSGRF